MSAATRPLITSARLILTVAAASIAADFVDGISASVIRLLAGLLVVLAIGYGVSRYGAVSRGAWLLVATGIGGWVAGDMLWDVFDARNFAATSGWYDVVNVLYLAMYPVIFAALVWIVSPRGRGGNIDSIVDSAVLFITGVVVLQIFVINPQLATRSGIEWFAAVYPFADALLLAAIGWLATTHNRRNASLWLLGTGLLLLIATDIAWEISQQGASTNWDPWINPLYPISYAVIASATLHPAAAHLADREERRSTQLHTLRLAFLCAALALIPIAAFLGPQNDVVVEVFTSVLVAVIGIRLAVLMRAVQNAHRRFANLTAAAPVGIFETDAALNITFANDAANRLVGGFAVGTTAGHLIDTLVDERDQAAVQQLVSTVLTGKPASVQVRIQDAAGAQRWIALSAVPVRRGPGAFSGAFVSTTDITAIKQAEEMRTVQATHDALTGLPNRRLLFDRLGTAITRLNRQSTMIAVLFLDLDGFKLVNDRYGHDAGDQLLTLVAKRILRTVRADDTVARVGGDEFIIILERVSDHTHAYSVADKIIQAIARPAALSCGEVTVGASIGIVLSADPCADPDDLIRDADNAMYEAKRSGGRAVTIADPRRDREQHGTDHDTLVPANTGREIVRRGPRRAVREIRR